MVPEQSTFFGLVKNLVEASVLLAAGLFLIGWSYLYGYYRGFGLSADDLNLSVDSVLVHSIPVIRGTTFGITLACALVVLLVLGSFRRVQHVLSKPALALLLLFGAGLVASRYASGVGRDNALRDMYLSTSTLPSVAFEGTEDANPTGCSFTETNYRLLARANGQVFVVLPVDDTGNIAASNIRVCSFPEKSIQAMRIQVGLAAR